MLDQTPLADNDFTILSVDPGTIFTGYAIIKADYQSLKMTEAKAWTIDASELIDDTDWDSELYGNRFARIKQQGYKFHSYLRMYDPLYVVCESPFYNPRRPNAYGALLEVVFTLRETLYRWDRWKMFHQIDPATAKKSIGVAGNSGDKSLVKQKLLSLDEFKNVGIEDFDEHSADALLIAKCLFDRIKASEV